MHQGVSSIRSAYAVRKRLLKSNGTPGSQLFTTLSAWLASWLFAFSAETQIFGGYLVWLVLFMMSLAGARVVYNHQEEKGWRSREDSGIGGEYESATPLTPYHDSRSVDGH